MFIESIDAFLAALSANDLLEPDHWQNMGEVRAGRTTWAELAEELVRRDWVTRYQIMRLQQDRREDGSQEPELAQGPYRIREPAGRGGMAQVFKAWDRKGRRLVALKAAPKKERGDGPHDSRHLHLLDRRAKHESEGHKRLPSHPNIVSFYEECQVNGWRWLVLEFVQGTNLDEKVKKDGPLPIRDACQFIQQAAWGLQHAYKHGLVHRDIKPANLMVTLDGQIKILDLGIHLQKCVGPEEVQQTRLTQTGAMMGSPGYMAPEQFANAHDVDIRADIYSLGRTLCCLLTGKKPDQGRPFPLASLRPDLALELLRVVEGMTAEERDRRFQTPAQVADELHRFLSHGTGQLTGFKMLADLMNLLGCVAAYIPVGPGQDQVNKERTEAKAAALRRAAEQATRRPEPVRVRLVAETGNSYLHARGPFSNAVAGLLDAGGEFQVILINKYFVAGHLISAAYQSPAALNAEGLNEDFADKYKQSIRGYKELRRRFGQRVQLRIAPCVVPSTLLTTEDMVFFEPYLFSNRANKAQVLFDTFELQLNPVLLRARELIGEHFDFLWAHSMPYEVWQPREDQFRTLYDQLRQLWRW